MKVVLGAFAECRQHSSGRIILLVYQMIIYTITLSFSGFNTRRFCISHTLQRIRINHFLSVISVSARHAGGSVSMLGRDRRVIFGIQSWLSTLGIVYSS